MPDCKLLMLTAYASNAVEVEQHIAHPPPQAPQQALPPRTPPPRSPRPSSNRLRAGIKGSGTSSSIGSCCCFLLCPCLSSCHFARSGNPLLACAAASILAIASPFAQQRRKLIVQMPDDIPSFADLRHTRSRKAPPRSLSLPPRPPSLTPSPKSPPPTSSPNNPAPSLHHHHPNPRRPRRFSSPRAGAAQDVFTVGELIRHVRNLVESAPMATSPSKAKSPLASRRQRPLLLHPQGRGGPALHRPLPPPGHPPPLPSQGRDAVRISRSLSVYESRGQLQLVAETMQQTGLGALLAATQALKKERLRREGLFDNQRPLPASPTA